MAGPPTCLQSGSMVSWPIGVWLQYLLSWDVPHTISECFQDSDCFIDGAARHSVAQDRFFGVPPMFFVVQVCGFVVSFHLVEVKLVQGSRAG